MTALLVLLPLLLGSSGPQRALSGEAGRRDRADDALRILPAAAFRAAGSHGGPFQPAEKIYRLENRSEGEVRWLVSSSASWVAVEPAGGVIAPGGDVAVRAVLVPERARALTAGPHAAFLRFVRKGEAGAAFRRVQLRVAAPRGLLVEPLGTFVADLAGGPRSRVYVLDNRGPRPLRWSAEGDAEWLALEPREGRLEPGESTDVRVRIAADVASEGEGRHAGELRFTNETDGVGSARIAVRVAVGPPDGLVVEPAGDVAWEPPVEDEGRPSASFLLRNAGEGELKWEVRTVGSGIRVDRGAGDLAPGEECRVRVEARGAPQDAGGPAAVVFVDGVGGTATRRLLFEGAGDAEAASTGRTGLLTRFGVTWTFDRDVQTGRFANGDQWVLGPVAVVGIDPPSVRIGARVMNGSMVNPSPRDPGQGYDSAMFGKYRSAGSYRPAANVALGVSPANPLVLPSHSSLVSTISAPVPGARPQLDTASILTVMSEPPPPGSFRPPYCGGDKTPRLGTGRLDRSLLERLPPVPATPPMGRVERWFERPWIDHIPDWIGRYHHPARNMPDYGREMCDQVGTAALMLHLDLPLEEKEVLLVRFVQLGIDLFGIVEDGGQGNWPPGGGHHSGRKWPILFAGLVLDESAMKGIGERDVQFNEDGQTFYVRETSPGVYNHGFGGYGPEHVGMPEWGNQHAKNPAQDDVRWTGGTNPHLKYRTCCTANVWWGELLAAHVMGAVNLWNHDALFDYQDRYRRVSRRTPLPGWTVAWSDFPLQMWDIYRHRY